VWFFYARDRERFERARVAFTALILLGDGFPLDG
jgi:hypothetical protein